MSNYLERLAAITDADNQMDLLRPLSIELMTDESTRTSEIGEAILRLYERSPSADGFGTFATLNMVLEEIDPEAMKPLVAASLARTPSPSWATREFAAMLSE